MRVKGKRVKKRDHISTTLYNFSSRFRFADLQKRKRINGQRLECQTKEYRFGCLKNYSSDYCSIPQKAHLVDDVDSLSYFFPPFIIAHR